MIRVSPDDSLLIDHRTVVMGAFLVDELIDAARAKQNFQDDGARSHSAVKTIYSQPGTKDFLRHWPLDANLHKIQPPTGVSTTLTENS